MKENFLDKGSLRNTKCRRSKILHLPHHNQILLQKRKSFSKRLREIITMKELLRKLLRNGEPFLKKKRKPREEEMLSMKR